MPVYTRDTIPEKVGSGVKDPEIAEWLKTGPVLGAHKPIHVSVANMTPSSTPTRHRSAASSTSA